MSKYCMFSLASRRAFCYGSWTHHELLGCFQTPSIAFFRPVALGQVWNCPSNLGLDQIKMWYWNAAKQTVQFKFQHKGSPEHYGAVGFNFPRLVWLNYSHKTVATEWDTRVKFVDLCLSTWERRKAGSHWSIAKSSIIGRNNHKKTLQVCKMSV